jgi:UDP-N-acetylglucosamine 2-epimerase
MKIISIVGARPQFIKSAPVSKAIAEAGYTEFQIHTGQHYDYELSQIFFKELGLSEPSINLGIGSGTQGYQTGQMLIGIEPILIEQKPDIVLVYGDTNSTLAGALASVKLQIKLAHIEAGLRSFNRQMPEEHNRILTDHCSDYLFCPTTTSVKNLANEGIRFGVHLVGDPMYDAVLLFSKDAERTLILQNLRVKPKDYLLLTIHRASNTDRPEVLHSIFSAFNEVSDQIIFPIHPRTFQAIVNSEIRIPENVKVINPIGYLDMLTLEKNARIILTDSGGIQKEAYFCKTPCITLRSETEWVETVESKWNTLVGSSTQLIISAIQNTNQPQIYTTGIYGDGDSAKKIVDVLIRINGSA